jgi:spermidine synthase
MVVALGTGITCGALLADESLERRTCVELLPEVVEASRLFEGNLGAPHDPRIDLRIADGRHELLRSDETWDLITLEPPPPSAAGVVNLYSRDFYALCRRRLAPGGLLAQWWPLATQNDEDSRSLVRSVLDVFPHVTAWTTELHEVLLVASVEPIELDGARIARRFASGGIARVLAEVGVESPAALLATYVTGRDGLERYVDGAPPVTDDRPLIEHARWLREGEFPRVLRRLEDLVEDPPLRNADAALRRAIHSERSELRAFHSAGRFAYQGDRAAWAAAADAVLRADPDNPYYLWLLGARLRERPPHGADR